MAQLEKKYLKIGTGSGELNSQDIPANYTPSNYTPSQVSSEGTDKNSAHLKGIDTALGSISLPSGDINPSTFAGANNQVAVADVTNFLFSSSDHFKARVNVLVDATANLYESFEILGTKKAADWEISQSSNGDNSLVNFTITSGGQIQYTSGNYAGFTSLTIKFRAEAL